MPYRPMISEQTRQTCSREPQWNVKSWSTFLDWWRPPKNWPLAGPLPSSLSDPDCDRGKQKHSRQFSTNLSVTFSWLGIHLVAAYSWLVFRAPAELLHLGLLSFTWYFPGWTRVWSFSVYHLAQVCWLLYNINWFRIWVGRGSFYVLHPQGFFSTQCTGTMMNEVIMMPAFIYILQKGRQK